MKELSQPSAKIQLGRGVPKLLRELAIPFRKVAGEGFWHSNRAILPELADALDRSARARLHQLHPDKGGNGHQFAAFFETYKKVLRAFVRAGVRNLSTKGGAVFTPAARVRLDKKAAQARARRKANLKYHRARARTRYARRKAAGWHEDVSKRRAITKRWRTRHRRKAANAQKRWRHAHPEKVRQYRRNYRASCERRGIKIKGGPESKKRMTPGTPEYEHRRAWRIAYARRRRSQV